jgi:hypothetical protein
LSKDAADTTVNLFDLERNICRKPPNGLIIILPPLEKLLSEISTNYNIQVMTHGNNESRNNHFGSCAAIKVYKTAFELMFLPYSTSWPCRCSVNVAGMRQNYGRMLLMAPLLDEGYFMRKGPD